MTRAQSRKYRGYKTQTLIAARWRANGVGPHAKDVGNGRGGLDIIDVPGLSTEIKARDDVSLVAALKQARAGDPSGVPIVIWRHNGQGETSMDEWTVTLSLVEFEKLWLVYRDSQAIS